MIGALLLPVLYVIIGVSVGVKCGAAMVMYLKEESRGYGHTEPSLLDPEDWFMAAFVALFAAVLWPLALVLYIFYRMVRREVAEHEHY